MNFLPVVVLFIAFVFMSCETPFSKSSSNIKFNGYDVTIKKAHETYKMYDATWNNTYMYIEIYKDTLLQWEYEKDGNYAYGYTNIPKGTLKGKYGAKGDTFTFVDYSFP